MSEFEYQIFGPQDPKYPEFHSRFAWCIQTGTLIGIAALAVAGCLVESAAGVMGRILRAGVPLALLGVLQSEPRWVPELSTVGTRRSVASHHRRLTWPEFRFPPVNLWVIGAKYEVRKTR